MKIAVAIPVYKSGISTLEQLSLSRCVAILGQYPLVLFGPSSLDYSIYLESAPLASRETFPDRYFTSTVDYSELLTCRSFYERFLEFDYILIHQLDAFVFRDSLREWCSLGYDYVGAPWLEEDGRWLGVGNGGLSLRNIASCLDVLRTARKESADGYWAMVQQTTPRRWVRVLKYPRKVCRMMGLGDDSSTFRQRFVNEGRPEDLFWGLHAVRFHPAFRVAPVELAFDFAIEGGLEQVQDRYSARPPLGCHQERFLRMIDRYLKPGSQPESAYEALVWQLAERAGMKRKMVGNVREDRSSGD